jgi:hypothetical protein
MISQFKTALLLYQVRKPLVQYFLNIQPNTLSLYFQPTFSCHNIKPTRTF